MSEELKTLQLSIDKIDNQLKELFKQRLEIVKEIGDLKNSNNLPITNRKREEEIIDSVATGNQEIDAYLRNYFSAIINISKQYQKNNIEERDFRKNSAVKEAIDDPVFSVSKLAKADNHPDTINASLGTLIGENGKIVAFDTVYKIYNNIENTIKASYAQSFVGNEDFLKTVEKWVLPDLLKKYRRTIATSGGSGAVSLAIKNTLDPYQTILLPDLGWTSFRLMAEENLLKIEYYSLFDEDFVFDIELLIDKIKKVAAYQKQIVIVINDPAHNPSGYCMSLQQWQRLIDFINSLNNDVVIINDIAYIDFTLKTQEKAQYFNLFDQLKDNCLCMICFSGSKTLSMYGMRIGACIVLGQQQSVDKMMALLSRETRSLWSNINNAAMYTFVELSNNHYQDYLFEKLHYINLLEQRYDIFKNEAEECGLAYYPYQTGFFIAVACCSNQKRDRLYKALIENHIYLVLVEKGLRIAICGLPISKITGLAKKIKDISLVI